MVVMALISLNTIASGQLSFTSVSGTNVHGACVNDPDFVDAYGYYCDAWEIHDCGPTSRNLLLYTTAQLLSISVACPAACKSRVECESSTTATPKTLESNAKSILGEDAVDGMIVLGSVCAAIIFVFAVTFYASRLKDNKEFRQSSSQNLDKSERRVFGITADSPPHATQKNTIEIESLPDDMQYMTAAPATAMKSKSWRQTVWLQSTIDTKTTTSDASTSPKPPYLTPTKLRRQYSWARTSTERLADFVQIPTSKLTQTTSDTTGNKNSVEVSRATFMSGKPWYVHENVSDMSTANEVARKPIMHPIKSESPDYELAGCGHDSPGYELAGCSRDSPGYELTGSGCTSPGYELAGCSRDSPGYELTGSGCTSPGYEAAGSTSDPIEIRRTSLKSMATEKTASPTLSRKPINHIKQTSDTARSAAETDSQVAINEGGNAPHALMLFDDPFLKKFRYVVENTVDGRLSKGQFLAEFSTSDLKEILKNKDMVIHVDTDDSATEKPGDVLGSAFDAIDTNFDGQISMRKVMMFKDRMLSTRSLGVKASMIKKSRIPIHRSESVGAEGSKTPIRSSTIPHEGSKRFGLKLSKLPTPQRQ